MIVLQVIMKLTNHQHTHHVQLGQNAGVAFAAQRSLLDLLQVL